MNGSCPVGVLNCLDCMVAAYKNGLADFTADVELMEFLATGELKPGLPVAKARRLVSAGEHQSWDGNRLWFSIGDWEREVPPQVETCGAHIGRTASLGFPSSWRLYAFLKHLGIGHVCYAIAYPCALTQYLLHWSMHALHNHCTCCPHVKTYIRSTHGPLI